MTRVRLWGVTDAVVHAGDDWLRDTTCGIAYKHETDNMLTDDRPAATTTRDPVDCMACIAATGALDVR